MARYKYHKYRKLKARKRKKRLFYRSRFFWTWLIFLVFFGVSFYLITLAPFFQVKEVEISGNKKIPTQELKAFIKEKTYRELLFLKTESIFLLNLGKMNNSVLEIFLNTEEVKIKRKLPATLVVEIKERNPIGLFCQNEKCFLIDRAGIAFEEISEKDFGKHELVLRLEDKEREISLGNKIAENETISLILEIQEKIKTKAKITIKDFTLRAKIADNGSLNAKTIENWEIHFDLQDNLDWQLTKLILVLEKEIPSERRNLLEYIDVRFGNFATYRYRDKSPVQEIFENPEEIILPEME